MNYLNKQIKKNPLFFALLLPALTDSIITLLGQSQAYWNGSKTVNEASPAYYFLLASPWVYLVAVIVWFIFWYWVFKKIKEPANLFLMFVFIVGHAWGSSTWIKKLLIENGLYTVENQSRTILGWSLLMLYFVVIAVLATYCLKIYMESRKK
ncbi:MAG: hypothetical protein Q8P13_00825 [bacterium]|nr:hypothetical protein [bacterium]